MTEQQRQEQYKVNCRQNAFDIFHNNGGPTRSNAAHEYLKHKFALLRLYRAGEITLKELNEEF